MKQNVVIKHESHNPQAILINDTWYIFHIGTGASTSAVKDCNESFSPFAAETKQMGGVVHKSSSPDGPFEAIAPTNYPQCNNPSPFLEPNGTLFLLCKWSLYSAPAVEGPWSHVANVKVPDSAARKWEDPFLWIDHPVIDPT